MRSKLRKTIAVALVCSATNASALDATSAQITTGTGSATGCNVQTATVMQNGSQVAAQNHMASLRNSFTGAAMLPPSARSCLDRWFNIGFGGLGGNPIDALIRQITNQILNTVTQVVCQASNQAMNEVNQVLDQAVPGVTLPGGMGKITPRVRMGANGQVTAGGSATVLGQTVPVTGGGQAPQQPQQQSGWFGQQWGKVTCFFGRCSQ